MPPLPCIPENAPFNAEQRAWLNGFLAGLFSDAGGAAVGTPNHAALSQNIKPSLLILFGSQTGTAEALAKKIGAEAALKNFAARVLDLRRR